MTGPGKVQERILRAALKEFAASGFAGARMDMIAKRAAVNKAMLYYYFSSKKSLYHMVLQQAVSQLLRQVSQLVTPQLSAALFLEKLPEIQIQFLLRHPELVRMIGFGLLQNADELTSSMGTVLPETSLPGTRPLLLGLMRKWHKTGELTEADPLQFLLNIISLTVFSFFGKPLVQTFSGLKSQDDQEFYRQRIKSVVRLLKQGMLS